MSAPQRAVYTALIGGYEQLLEQPVAGASGIPFICFTDDADLRSDTWEVRLVEPTFPGDSVRSARVLKIRGHESLGAFDETLWIDNSVLLKTDPVGILSEWLTDAELAVPHHSFRSNLAAEFAAVMNGGLDESARVVEQLAHYQTHTPWVLEREVLWTALLARRKSVRVESVMQKWLDQVLRYSRRDQLSVSLAVDGAADILRVVELDNHSSRLHEWRVAAGRKPVPARTAETELSAVAAFAHLHAEIDELTMQFNHAVQAREEELALILQSRSWRFAQRMSRALSLVRSTFRR